MRRGRRAVLGLAAAALALAAPDGLEAQRRGGGPPAAVVLAPADVRFPPPTDIDFDAGWVDQGGITVSITPRNRNRIGWRLFVRAAAPDMGGYGKPVGDLLVRVEGSGGWVPLSTTPQLVAEGAGPATVVLEYRLSLDWSADLPGTYSVPLEYETVTF